MRKSLLAVMLSAAAAMLAMAAPTTAKADLPLLGATFHVSNLSSLQPTWAVVTHLDLGFRAPAPMSNLTAGRRSYQLLVALPATESAVTTYDVKPIVDSVTNQKMKLGGEITLTLLAGKNFLVADVFRTQVAFQPMSFGSGVFTVGRAF